MTEPPAPTPVQLTLDAANYQGAVRNAPEWIACATWVATNKPICYGRDSFASTRTSHRMRR